MKIITNVNWIILITGVLILTFVLLSKKSFGSDPAGRGLAEAFSVIGLIVFIILLVANFLPFRWVRISIFVSLWLPMVGVLPQLVRSLITKFRKPGIEQGRYDGTYYFADPLRRQLARAIAANDLPQAQTLLQSPIPKLSEPGADGITLLDFAAMCAMRQSDERGSVALLSLLIDKGATIETSNPSHMPTHVRVCRSSSSTLMEWFLKEGANPNAKDPTNEYAPMLFSTMTSFREDRTENIRLLIEHGADPNSLYPLQARSWLAGHTALQAAARQEFWDVCQVLLENGADPLRVGPQQFVFTEFVANQAKLYAQLGTTPDPFEPMQQTLAQVVAKKNNLFRE